MKYNELYRRLKKAGCFLDHHGGRHDVWVNPKTGGRTEFGRHGSQEVPIGTLKSIYKELGL